MSTLNLTEAVSYEAFVGEWGADTDDTQLLWQLLDQLADNEVLVQMSSGLRRRRRIH